MSSSSDSDQDKGPQNDEEWFVDACEKGNLQAFRQSLPNIDVHHANEWAFRAACNAGHAAVVEELLALKGSREVDVHVLRERGFLSACYHGHSQVVRLLLALTGPRQVDVNADNGRALEHACANGHLGVVRELLGPMAADRIDIHIRDEAAFQAACGGGHLGIVRLLLSLEGDRRIDVHAENEGAFLRATLNGRLPVMRELLALTGDRVVNVHAADDYVFFEAVKHRRPDVVRELLAIPPPHGYTWDTQSQQVALERSINHCLLDNVQRGSGRPGPRPELLQLLHSAPLPPNWITVLFKVCASRMFILPRCIVDAHSAPTSEAAAAVAQQALMFAVQTGEGRAGNAERMTGGAIPALDALALAYMLLPSQFAALREVLRNCETHGEKGHVPPGRQDLVAHLRRAAWCGVCVPIAPLPGVEALVVVSQAQPVLWRPARRRLVLRRAAAQRHRRRVAKQAV